LSRIEHISVSGHYSEINRHGSITIGEARRMDVCALPIFSCSLRSANTIGAAIRAPLIGEVQQIKKTRENNLLPLLMRIASSKGAESAPRFTYKHRAQPSAINISSFV
jgi:hypothetical protein